MGRRSRRWTIGSRQRQSARLLGSEGKLAREVPLLTERYFSDVLASLRVRPRGVAGSKPASLQGRAVELIQLLWQEIEEDLSLRDRPRLFRLVEDPPLDDGQPGEEAAAVTGALAAIV